jgi:glycosyltransferase involved in cell wall biosynthesis
MVFQVASMLQAERRAMIAAAVTFVCSETDRHHLQKCIRSSPVQVIPNATTFPDLQLAPASERVVLFIGTFGYRPNVVAADTLITEIWPKILAKIPDATLVIAGRKPENLRSYTTAPFGVVFAGFVPDIATVYRTASVVCCPINSGSGTRIKIIEAASYAKPIVSTTIGAEGLMFESGREIFIEDRPSAMAERCIELLLSPRLAHDVGTAARAKAIMTYERSAIVGHVSGILQTLLSHND